MKTNMKRAILITGLCFLVAVAIVCAYLILDRNTGTSPGNEALNEDPASPSQTPLAEETDVAQEPAVTDEPQPAPEDKVYIRVYTTYRELGRAIEKYARENWDFDFEVQTWDDAIYYGYNDIVNMVDDNLKNNAEPMEVFCVPAAYAARYVRGEYSRYVCTYEELGIDVDALLEKMDIPQYIIDAGTNRDGKIVALPVLSDASVFMYRRSVARRFLGPMTPIKYPRSSGAAPKAGTSSSRQPKRLGNTATILYPGQATYFIRSMISVSFPNS